MLALRLTVRCCPPRIARIAIYLLDSFKPCIGYATVWLYVLAGKEVTQQYGCMCLQEKKLRNSMVVCACRKRSYATVWLYVLAGKEAAYVHRHTSLLADSSINK